MTHDVTEAIKEQGKEQIRLLQLILNELVLMRVNTDNIEVNQRRKYNG